MNYFIIGVGGTGAKLIHAMLHMSAAGLLPPGELHCLLVDSDGANGNIKECLAAFASYKTFKSLALGNANLLKTTVELDGPWTPITNDGAVSFNDFFHYTQKQSQDSDEAALMELLYAPKERSMQIKQGFRGRPAIGSAIFADRIDFDSETSSWYRTIERIRRAATSAPGGRVPVLFAGSVFGGTGAAGVPTIFRVLDNELREHVPNRRLGLTLMLPYFTFSKVPGEEVQADPHAFPEATAEALTYYHERGFLSIGNSMYALGEKLPAPMPVSAVGADAQKNPPHFLELVAAAGAVRFLSGYPEGEANHTLSIAMRENEPELHWADLPFEEHARNTQIACLKQMIQFAVVFRYVYLPWISREARDDKALSKSSSTVIRRHVVPYGINSKAVVDGMGYVADFTEKFLNWLLSVSTSHRAGFQAALVNIGLFAVPENGGWRLKEVGEFREKEFDRQGLFPGDTVKRRLGDILDKASGEMELQGTQPNGVGYLVRALYEACK